MPDMTTVVHRGALRTVSVTQTFLRVIAGAPCGSENRIGCPADSVQQRLKKVNGMMSFWPGRMAGYS